MFLLSRSFSLIPLTNKFNVNSFTLILGEKAQRVFERRNENEGHYLDEKLFRLKRAVAIGIKVMSFESRYPKEKETKKELVNISFVIKGHNKRIYKTGRLYT